MWRPDSPSSPRRRQLIPLEPPDTPSVGLPALVRWAPVSARAERLQRRAARADVPLSYMGTRPTFPGHLVIAGQGRDWVIVELAADPLFADPTGYPMPESSIQALSQVRAAGIDFDLIYIAHEVRSGAVRPDEPPTLEALQPPPPRRLRDLSRRLSAAAHTGWQVGSLPLAVAPMVVSAGVVVAALPAAAAALVALDPIVLGVVLDRDSRAPCAGQPASWFYLTHWDYAEH